MPEPTEIVAVVSSSTKEDEGLRNALLQALGFDRLSEPMRELALAIARQYDLDPMLRHLVMVDGKPYITRDGLLHVAHKSGDFDGIEVEQPVLDGAYWRTWAIVYRKSFSRPFRYPGRYPASGGNAKYNEEMCIKVAEVMTLRRAFDVAAPVIEERWESEEVEVETDQPQTLQDKIAARAASLADPATATEAPAQVATESETPLTPEQVEAVDRALNDTKNVITITEGAGKPIVGEFRPIGSTIETPPRAVAAMTLATFGDLMRDVDRKYLAEISAEMFPAARKFGDLKPDQLQEIIDRVERERAAEEAEDDAEAETITATLTGGPVSPGAVYLVGESGPETVVAREPVVVGNIVMCDMESPYGDGLRCTMDKGHTGTHRSGVRSSW